MNQQFSRCCLKIFLFLTSGSHIVQWSGTVCAILVERLMRNIWVNLNCFEFGPAVQKEMSFKDISIFCKKVYAQQMPDKDRSQ